jgi:hypothetical protein
VHLKGAEEMKYMDIDCYERGCACASSNRVAGEDSEVVKVVRLRELSDDEIADLIEAVNEETGRCSVRIFDHTKVLLRKLKEKYEQPITTPPTANDDEADVAGGIRPSDTAS